MHTLSPQQPPQLCLLPIFPSWIFHIFEPLFSPAGCSREIYIFSVLQFCPLLLLVNVAIYITIVKQGHLLFPSYYTNAKENYFLSFSLFWTAEWSWYMTLLGCASFPGREEHSNPLTSCNTDRLQKPELSALGLAFLPFPKALLSWLPFWKDGYPE